MRSWRRRSKLKVELSSYTGICPTCGALAPILSMQNDETPHPNYGYWWCGRCGEHRFPEGHWARGRGWWWVSLAHGGVLWRQFGQRNR